MKKPEECNYYYPVPLVFKKSRFTFVVSNARKQILVKRDGAWRNNHFLILKTSLMGKINKGSGILGGFSGTVGTVVGSNWRGIDTMRAVAKPKKGRGSPAPIGQPNRISVAA